MQVELIEYCPVGGNSQEIDLPFLTPLSVAGCGRLQLGARNCPTLVPLLKVIDSTITESS